MQSKASLRSRVKEMRATLGESDITTARSRVARAVLTWLEASRLPPGTRVAAYVPMRTEPGSTELLAGLRAAGFEVIVPLTLADNDLDWQTWSPESPGPPLGPDAITTAQLVLVPAFAVDPAGRRLGRGGGSYDRALARVGPGTVLAALLYEDEFVDEVPVDPWDRAVTAVVTPSGWRTLG